MAVQLFAEANVSHLFLVTLNVVNLFVVAQLASRATAVQCPPLPEPEPLRADQPPHAATLGLAGGDDGGGGDVARSAA